MSYNIVRDCQSQYVFNGKFMYTVFQMAYFQYVNDMKDYFNINPNAYTFSSDFNEDSIASRQGQGVRRGYTPDSDSKEYMEKAKMYDKTH